MFWSVPYCRMLRSRINSDGESRETCKPERMVVELACVRVCKFRVDWLDVSYVL